jgi:hypothetical protein
MPPFGNSSIIKTTPPLLFSPPARLTASAIVSLIAQSILFALLIILFIFNWFSEELWLLVLTVILTSGFVANTAWALALAKQHWRRPHWSLLLVWAANMWLIYALLFLMLLIASHGSTVSDQAIQLISLGILPAISLLGAFLMRSRRSEWLLVIAVPGPLSLLLIIGAMMWEYDFDPARRTTFNTFAWSIFITTGALQVLPPAIAVAYLHLRRLWGTCPANTSLCCDCDYNLTGSVQASQTLCPECGTAIPAAQQAWIQNNISAPATPNPPSPAL